MPNVRIHSESGPGIDEPTDEQIVATLRTLHDVGNPFAILEVGDDFIQALRETDGSYRLKYRDHATGEVLHAITPAPTLPQVEQAFLPSRRGDLAWAGRSRVGPALLMGTAEHAIERLSGHVTELPGGHWSERKLASASSRLGGSPGLRYTIWVRSEARVVRLTGQLAVSLCNALHIPPGDGMFSKTGVVRGQPFPVLMR